MTTTYLRRFIHFLAVLAVVSFQLYAGEIVLAAHNPHEFSEMTDACGSCHSTHAASGKHLLSALAAGLENEIYRNCMYCHKSGGQSKLDVYNGAILGSDGKVYASSGGGIAQMVTVEGAVPQYLPVTSKHDVTLADGVRIWTPGADMGEVGQMTITCTSCHTPHGGDSCFDCHAWDISVTAQRRLLRNTVNGVSITPPIIEIGSGFGKNESVKLHGDVNSFCAACHVDFNALSAGAGDTDTGTYTQHKRHRVGMNPASYPGINPSAWAAGYLDVPGEQLPLQTNGGAQQVSCLTCHFAHGSVKTNSVFFNRTDGTISSSSTLLRLNNRGVCEVCHDK